MGTFHRVCMSAAVVFLSATTARVAPAEETSVLKTFSSIGKESRALDGGREAELLRHDGKGCLTHMWFGGDWPGYEKTRIRVYVDGERTPSIDMEMGLGHGVGFGEAAAPWGTARSARRAIPAASTTRIGSRSARVPCIK